MRSAVLILLPILLLAAAFYFVVGSRPASPLPSASQTNAGPATRKVVPTTIPQLDPNASMIGKSGNVWVQTLNKRTGNVANEFRASRFDPGKDGTVDVTFPQARFYSENGGMVTLEGSGGKVTLSQPGDRADPQAMGSASPTDGDLKDVIIRFYDAETDDVPSLIAQVPAVHFDTIGNRISTVDSVIEGKGVLAEAVPVTVRGRDFEFDGYGLQMSWNDRDGRLESLEINRGERLLIKNLAKFNLPETGAKPQAAFAPAFQIGSPSDLFVGLMAQAATEPVKRRQLYHATFDKDVKINRDGQQLAAGDVMRVILPLGDPKPVATANEPPPTEENRAQRARRRAASTAPAIEKPVTEDTLGVREPTHKNSPTTRPEPTTKPMAEGPIEVLWTGKLTVRPLERIADAPKDIGQMVELVGAPAWVEENGSHADARLIRIEPDTGKVRFEPGGPVKAIAVHDSRGADLRSRSPLLVDRTAGTAIVTGGGTLTAPANPPSQPDPTNLSWSRRLTLTTTTGGTDQSLKAVLIEGEAKVVNPQLDVASDTLALAFDKPTKPAAKPTTTSSTAVTMPAADFSALRSVIATGGATMKIGKDDATRRSLAAQKIDLGFVPTDNGAGLKTVKCDENVKLDDAAGFSLACAKLDATVKPTSIDKPAVAKENGQSLDDVDALLATGDVTLTQADGSSASGDRVELTKVADVKHLTLTGAPARVSSARGGLEGQQILIDPITQDVNVPGPGQFVGSDEKQPDAKMAVAWLESMSAIGKTGVCDLVGGVKIDGTSATGTHLKGTSERGRIYFTPRQQSTAATHPAMADTSLDSVRSVHLSGNVDVAMEAIDVRTSSMQTEQVDIDLENSTVTAPQPGRLLVIDGHSATTKPTTLPATMEAMDDTTTMEPVAEATTETASTEPTTRPTTRRIAPRAGSRGPESLAVAWKNQMLWKMREGQLTFDGGVRLGFEKRGSNDPIRLTSERVVCGLTPVQTGKGVDQMSQKIELRTVTAEQAVSVRSRLASFDATTLTFDALTNRATALGDANTPVEVFDSDATSRVGFSAITWNVDTGLIEDFRDIDGRLLR